MAKYELIKQRKNRRNKTNRERDGVKSEERGLTW
jgi:hypothetical protein